ncbi:MAG: hypothetical protein RL434_2442, partial [Pseudomonadota bacterium]
PGPGVDCGKDHTLFAVVEGRVQFLTKGLDGRKYVSVVPA